MADHGDLPSYRDLILPTLRAVEKLRGSAKSREITDWITDDLNFDDESLGFMYENRAETAVVIDRMDWARSDAPALRRRSPSPRTRPRTRSSFRTKPTTRGRSRSFGGSTPCRRPDSRNS
jgi:hypothetical protein